MKRKRAKLIQLNSHLNHLSLLYTFARIGFSLDAAMKSGEREERKVIREMEVKMKGKTIGLASIPMNTRTSDSEKNRDEIRLRNQPPPTFEDDE